jgi:hypothetical protein
MPLVPSPRKTTLYDADEGVLFAMSDNAKTVSVFVSRQALDHVDPKPHSNGTIERFNEYRAQFEEIASDKYDRGHLERDGNVCIRGRDLPGAGH